MEPSDFISLAIRLSNSSLEADYDLESTKFSTAANAAAMIRVSQEIVDALQRCRAEPAFSEARVRIRAYARDVLRMTLDDS